MSLLARLTGVMAPDTAPSPPAAALYPSPSPSSLPPAQLTDTPPPATCSEPAEEARTLRSGGGGALQDGLLRSSLSDPLSRTPPRGGSQQAFPTLAQHLGGDGRRSKFAGHTHCSQAGQVLGCP